MRVIASGVALAGLALLSGARPAAAAPDLAVTAGTTMGVTGQPGRGGASTSLGGYWPVEERFAFGVTLFADDLGTGLAELRDLNTGSLLGTVASTHRWSFGGEWRAEATLVQGRRWRGVWGAGLGYGRQEQDARGENRGALSGVVVSTSATLLRTVAPGHAFGPTVTYRRGFQHGKSDPDRATGWASAAIEWRWSAHPEDGPGGSRKQ